MKMYRIEIAAKSAEWESHCCAIVPESEKATYLRFIQKRKRQTFQGKMYYIKTTLINPNEKN